MYGPLFSVLLMGMVPVSGWSAGETSGMGTLFIAPPASQLTASLPVLTLPGRVSASGVLILDLKSGQTLYQRSASVPRPMASLTKLMTALLIVENHALDEWVTISETSDATPGSTANLPKGDQVQVGDLLSALLIGSANDSAIALAEYHAGSTEAFVEEMNARAKELGLKTASYANPTGLDNPRQVSSPRDTAWLAMFVLRFPDIAQRMAMRTAQFTTKNGVQLSVTHTHQLLRQDDSGVIAGKTGTTEGAGQCLLSIVEEGDRRYLVVLLSSVDRYADMRRIVQALTP